MRFILLSFFISTLFFRQTVSGQLTIASLEMHSQEGELLYSFPLLKGANNNAAQKINRYLQSELLSNDSMLIDTNTVFANSMFIGDDSLFQVGYTSISYEVAVNDGDVFSVSFLQETLAAYPETFYSYFSFDSKTGEILDARDLFTPEGILALKRRLIRERTKRIAERVNEMGTADVGKEDIEWARTVFNECNTEAEAGDFIVMKGSILFWKGFCFPHVARAFEADLDIQFTYKQLAPYLSKKGKKLLQKR